MGSAALMMDGFRDLAIVAFHELHFGRHDAPFKFSFRQGEDWNLRLPGELGKELRAIATDGEHSAGTIFVLAKNWLEHFGSELYGIVVQSSGCKCLAALRMAGRIYLALFIAEKDDLGVHSLPEEFILALGVNAILGLA